MAGPSGHEFGKYLLLDRIAAGGMAEIFRAKYVAAAGVTKSVVIKRILPHYAGNPAFVSMFTNEAKIAMTLAHGNIAQVFDFGEIDGEYFLAMEFVNGQSLSRIARGARDMGFWVPLPIAAYIMAEVCAGLHYAHMLRDEQGNPLGIVHRDVSPQNVIVSYEGQVKLVDFGIAKIRSAGDKETEHGAMKGKYVYFSPEQARARPLDGRSDIFAVGIVLYELVTGKRPFEGKMMEVLSAITKGSFIPPSLVNPQVPRELEQIILRALALKPEDRYPTATEMGDALRRYQHDADPDFTGESVAHLSRFVCREELEREGLHIEVPADFLELMGRWRAPPLSRPEHAASIVTASERGQVDPSDRIATEAGSPNLDGGEAEEKPRRGRRVALAAAVLALGVVAGLAVSFLVLRRVFTLEIASEPPGAAVALDGRALGLATPAHIEGVDADRPHELELTMIGRKAWRQSIPPQKVRRLAVEASLAATEGERVQDASGNPDAKDPVDESPSPVPVAAWPEVKHVSVLASAHAVSIPATPAARVRLDPSHTYKLALEGSAEAAEAGGARRPMKEVVWFAERAPGGSGEAGFGVLTRDGSVAVAGARALYAFALRRPGETGTGSLQLRASDQRTHRSVVLGVDAQQNALVPGDRQPRFIGLDPGTSYALDLSGRAGLGASGTATRLVYCLDGERAVDPVNVLQAGSARVVRGATGLWLLLPDDDAADNEGELSVTITQVGAAPR